MVNIERRQSTLHATVNRLQAEGVAIGHKYHNIDLSQSEPLPYSSPEAHHHMSMSKKNPVHIGKWLAANHADPALRVSPSSREYRASRGLTASF